jgi:hypothetical protein
MENFGDNPAVYAEIPSNLAETLAPATPFDYQGFFLLRNLIPPHR